MHIRIAANARLGVCLVLTGILTIGGTSIAAVGATVPSSDARIADAVAAAPGSSDIVASAPGASVTSVDGSSATLPASGGTDITFLGSDGAAASLSVPSTAPVHTQVLDGGAARAILAITDSTKPDSYAFDLALPEGLEPRLEPDGSVAFVPTAAIAAELAAQGVDAELAFGGLAQPWAKDADGVAVPTHYSLTGSTVVQHVDLDATSSFPVIADPEMEWKGYYATLTYTASETLGMRDQGVIIAGMLVAAAGMAAFGPPGALVGAAMVGIGAASVGIIATTASNAVGDGRCLSVDVPSMMPSIIDC